MLAEYAVSKTVQYVGCAFVKKVIKKSAERLAVGLVVGTVMNVARPLKPKHKREKWFA